MILEGRAWPLGRSNLEPLRGREDPTATASVLGRGDPLGTLPRGA